MDENNNKKVKLPPLDFRIPKWDLNELQERLCPICNNSDSITKHIRPDSLTVKFCNNCNTFFVSPAPSPQELSKFYANYDESHRREPIINTDDLVHNYKDINPLVDFRIQELSKHISLLNSKVLDVGFGRAQFLYSLMKLGAIPFGIELDEKAIEYATALGIHNVHKGSIEDMSDYTKFNLIILNDLLEHPLNPMSLIRKAHDLLENNGLLMIWTPNGEITDNELSPTTFRVDLEHMQYLTPKSCKYIAKEFNFKIIHLETLGFPNLIGIDKPLKSTPNLKNQIYKVIKLIPGASMIYYLLNKLKKKLMPTIIEERMKGAYHLFCIMQKSV